MELKQFIELSSFDLIQNNQIASPKNKEIHLRCCGRRASQFCINQNCTQQQVITCDFQDCKCHDRHVQCPKFYLKHLDKLIQKKFLPVQDMRNLIDTKIQNIIDSLSDLREDLLNAISTQIKYSQLHQIENQFLNHAYSQQQTKNNFNPKDLKLLFNLSKKKVSNNLSENIKQLLTKFEKQQINNIQLLRVELSQQFKQNLKERTIQFQKLKNQQIQRLKTIQQSKLEAIIQHSSIIKQTQEATVLLNFFKEPVKKLSLVYKASENQFSVQRFYQTCGKITHTLILCETRQKISDNYRRKIQQSCKKIVGGYTPLCYADEDLQLQQKQVFDRSRKSFMFSLTNQDKFILKDPNSCAIIRIKDKNVICFGNYEIYIGTRQKSNYHDNNSRDLSIQPVGILQCNKSYYNQNYNKSGVQIQLNQVKDKGYRQSRYNQQVQKLLSSMQFTNRFNGLKNLDCQKSICLLKQWQVWKVQFQ